jgi:hypothetical protein
MQRTVTYATGMYSQLYKIGSQTKLLSFVRPTYHPGTILMWESVGFLKPKGVFEQNSLRYTVLSNETLLSRSIIDILSHALESGKQWLADSTLSFNTPCASVFFNQPLFVYLISLLHLNLSDEALHRSGESWSRGPVTRKDNEFLPFTASLTLPTN